jgi:hypothetical protein
MPQNILTITRKADADLSAKQYFLVKATATGVDLNTTLNGPVLGVLTNDPASGKAAAVQVVGVARVVAGAAFAAGDLLKSDANGKAIKQTGEAAGTLVHAFGIALEAAAADLDQVEVLLIGRAVVNNAVS